MVVIKRDGREVEFDKRKISNAVLKAIIEVDGKSTLDTERIAYDIADRIEEKSKDTALTVEQIQDMVEVQLMLSYRKDIAKAYILYRNERTKIRDRNSTLIKNIMVRLIQRLIIGLMQMLMNLHFLDVKKRLLLILAK